MRKNRNVFALLLAAVLAFSMVPASALAITGEPVGQVYVTIDSSLSSSNQFTNAGWVDIYSDDSAITIIQRFAQSEGLTSTISEYAWGGSYISEIGGLVEFADGSESGWMGLINDWFTADAFAGYTVVNDGITDGDTLSIQYTVSGYGADLGGTWANNDKTLENLFITLPGMEPTSLSSLFTPTFASGTYEYSLYLPADVDSVNVT
ncbi:MAG: hypothetical protein HGA54_07350, partial [Actinobacteria bacterium]|nr:hypothetical protein [Actinomycetota bacterium]